MKYLQVPQHLSANRSNPLPIFPSKHQNIYLPAGVSVCIRRQTTKKSLHLLALATGQRSLHGHAYLWFMVGLKPVYVAPPTDRTFVYVQPTRYLVIV